MKVIKLLFATILLSVICSCGGKPYPHLMQVADSLMNMYPDSALILLEQLKGSIKKEPEATQMYYRLLTIKAKEKSYSVFNTDSLIKPLLSYYEKKKNKTHLPEIYYYAGLTYRTIGDTPQALDYLQKALNASEGITDYRLIYKIYHQMGMICHSNQSQHSKSIVPFRNAYQYAKLTGDSTLMTYGLLYIARAFQRENKDSLSLYYRKAGEMARKINNVRLYCIINSELAGCYYQRKEYQKAYEALHASQTPMNHPALYYSIFANTFYKMNKLDSAIYYYKKVLSIDNQYDNADAYYKDQQNAYRMISKIARQQGKLAEALDYTDKYLIYTDSLQEAMNTAEVRKINAMYNYQFREKENRRIEGIAQKQKIWIIALSISIIFIFTLILSICIIYQLRKRQKVMQIERQKEKLKEIAEEQYRNSQQFIIVNEKRIEAIKEKLQNTEYQKNEIENALQEAEKQLLELTNKQTKVKQKLHAISEKAFKESQIYKDFYHVAGMPNSETISKKGKITSKDWEELVTTINKTYNNFTERLQILYPSISEHEIRICILLKMSIPPTSIANLTARSKQAITSSRKKLYEKTHNQVGTPDLWDSFIQNF
jgi:tetratricopeptide (TPR) repeat protein